jgi:hypothetical protein
MLIGEPSIGKSWLTMGMAVAVAGGVTSLAAQSSRDECLYVDEENPEDLIYGRLHKLGLTPAIAKNIRYLSNLGIRLDKQADDLVTEALDTTPPSSSWTVSPDSTRRMRTMRVLSRLYSTMRSCRLPVRREQQLFLSIMLTRRTATVAINGQEVQAILLPEPTVDTMYALLQNARSQSVTINLVGPLSRTPSSLRFRTLKIVLS